MTKKGRFNNSGIMVDMAMFLQRRSNSPIANVDPFLTVDIRTGEIVLDRRNEACPWLATSNY